MYLFVLITAAGFLSPNFEPVSALTTAPTPTACVEPGFPDHVHEDGTLWYSLVRECQVLRCSAGVNVIFRDTCASSSEASTSPPPPPPAPAGVTAPATAGHSSGHYHPCTDLNTGLSHEHGATWSGWSVHCVQYRCMNGTVQVAGFCASPASEPDPPGPQRPAAEFPAPEPTAPGPAAAETPATLPPLAARPISTEGHPGEAGSFCVDDLGGLVQVSGSSWTVPTQPCLRYHCQDGIIHSSTITCTPAPPGCTPLPVPPDRCCPSFTCPQGPLDCDFGGRTYRSGDVFADDPLHPCQQRTCDDGLVVALRPPIVCPAVYCAEPDWPEGSCCKTCPGQWPDVRGSRVLANVSKTVQCCQLMKLCN